MRRNGKKYYGNDPEPTVINLEAASQHYKIDRKTIRATVAKYPDFPRVAVGGTKNGWKLDTDAIDEWLKTNDWWRGTREPRHKKLKDEHGNPIVDPSKAISPAIIKLQEAQKKQDDKSVVQTKLLQLELDKKMGLLVDREEVVTMLSAKMSRFAKQLELLPNLIGKKLGMTDEGIRLFRDYLDEARRALVKDDEGYFAQMSDPGA